MSRSSALRTLLVAAWLLPALVNAADDVTAAFDRANKAYEQRRFDEAARMYEHLLASGARTANVYFNLGNAHFKAGELGRAIAAYRNAQKLDPRDSDLLANLQFVRRKVSEDPPAPLWKRALRFLTPNEWTVIGVLLFWGLFGVLTFNSLQPARKLRNTSHVLAVATLLSLAATFAAIHDGVALRHGVVVARQASARFGPLVDAQVAFQLPDGAEVVITDSKDDWLQIRDPADRRGWVKRSDVLPLAGSGVSHQDGASNS